MRILLVHSRYSSSQPSGENRLVDQQHAALSRAGHDVLLVQQSTDDRAKYRLYPLEAAVTVATGRGRSPVRAIREYKPDVVHVHNLFPNFGRSWVHVVNQPLVATMHNYRTLCPAATLYRDGHDCVECPTAGSARPALQYACYRGSRLQTLPLAVSTKFGRDPVLQRANRVQVLHDDMRDEFARRGVPLAKLVVRGGFVSDDRRPKIGAGGDYWLYVGRLAEEKGIVELVSRWPAGRRLLIVGAGPEEQTIRDIAPHGVEILGHRSSNDVSHLMGGAVGLVFPSQWREGLALVCLEALAAGTPILNWAGPAAREITRFGIGHNVAAEPLAGVVEWAEAAFPGMRGRCSSVFDAHFSERAWVADTLDTYRDCQ